MNRKARVIAFYLPQFHPIPENDEWWGKGFTEWTNVGRAKPLFKGHYQPRVPADLGYYDLRLPEVREQQAEMAYKAGIEGFCYWHYWFGNGKQLLERPFNEVLMSGKPDFPFCLGWANISWTKRNWNGAVNREIADLIKQDYPGDDDIRLHFNTLLPAFKDHRYITVEGKPLFLIYKPLLYPDVNHFIDLWNQMAVNNGIPGFYFIGHDNDWRNNSKWILEHGFDAVNPENLQRVQIMLNKSLFLMRLRNRIAREHPRITPLNKYSYKSVIKHWFTEEDYQTHSFPCIIPNWDRTPRSGRSSLLFTGSTPELFKKHVKDALNIVNSKDEEHRIIFLKSWNEWAEGNYMEPDLKYGHGYLDALRDVIIEDTKCTL